MSNILMTNHMENLINQLNNITLECALGKCMYSQNHRCSLENEQWCVVRVWNSLYQAESLDKLIGLKFGHLKMETILIRRKVSCMNINKNLCVRNADQYVARSIIIIISIIII